jgi:hypothetical protein
MKTTVVLLICLSMLLVGCRSTRETSLTTLRQSSSVGQDSVYDHLSVTLDTLKTPYDSVSVFIPDNWVADTANVSDPAPMSQKKGRATVTVRRENTGIRVTASCDSLLTVLVSQQREIFRLKKEIVNNSTATNEKDVLTRYRVPLWAWLTMAVSLLANVLIIYLNIKKRVL